MKDIIRTTAITSAMFLTAISPISANAKGMETPLTSTVKTTTVTKLWDTNDGSVGRLTIGGYSAELYKSSSQYTVDAEDSAAYIPWGNIVMIADHAYQGFRIIRSLGPGAVGTITDNSTITYITMASSYQGYNNSAKGGSGIDLADGRYAEQVTDGQYMLYTCNDSEGYNVTVTYWYVSGSEAVAPAPAPEPVYEAPAAVEPEPAAEPVQQAAAPAAQVSQSSASTPSETVQAVVDNTETATAQPNEDQTTATAQNSASSVKTEKANNTAVPEFAKKADATNNNSAATSGNPLIDLLTANKQEAGATEDEDEKIRRTLDMTMYYADNRRWLALNAEQSDNFIRA